LNYYYYHHRHGSTGFCWALAAFSVSSSYTQWIGLLGRGISPSQGLYLHTEQHKHRINVHCTDIHALSGIRTYDPSVRASADISCLRPRGHCDRPLFVCGSNYLYCAIKCHTYSFSPVSCCVPSPLEENTGVTPIKRLSQLPATPFPIL
jgi:hypothetical protein